MTELPEGWVMVAVGDAGEVSLGRQRAPKYHHGDGMRPYLRVANVFEDRIDTSDVMEMHFSEEEFERYRLRPGDILLNEGQSPQFLGRPAIYRGYPHDIAFTNSLIRFRARPAVTPEWALIVFRHHMHSKRFMQESRITTNIAHLSAKRFSTVEFPIPPLLEQKRIVAAVEEQFSRIDAGVEALTRARERLHVLRDQDILALVAASGETRRLGDVAEVRLGRQRSPKNHVGPRMLPYLRAANVTWLGLDLRDVKRMNFSPSESGVYSLSPGDILVSEASGSASEVGKPTIWDGSIPECCFQNTLLRVRSAHLIPDYLYFVLLAHARSGTFARKSRGVGIHHLSKSGLSDLKVPVPPQSRQEELVASVRTRQTSIARVSDEINQQLQRAKLLRSSLLSAAFSGKLVCQDLADEPASVLLERIAAERANGHKAARIHKLGAEVTT